MQIHRCTPVQGWHGLVDILQAAGDGDEVHLGPGTYNADSSLEIARAVRLVGEEAAVISRIGAAVLLIHGDDVGVAGLRFEGAVAGQISIHVRQSERVTIAGCTFDGGGKSESAVVIRRSRAVTVVGCNAQAFAPARGEHGGAINFLSSEGRIEDNECSRGNTGIHVCRDPDAPAEASNVHVLGNRCHDNTFFGIAFSSSLGRIESNDCWGSRWKGGVVVQRDSLALAEPSDVQVIGNLCHDNEGDGILILSSNGLLEDNECFGSRRQGGIACRRDPEAASAASSVRIAGNRCHGNEKAGICLASTVATVEKNECWGSLTRGGILVERDQRSIGDPSDVKVYGNRCHDNEQAGVSFFSSIGQIENNDCWGSRTRGGIVVERDEKSVDQPSSVQVIANRCHDNEQAGINFISSAGVIEDNECWSSRALGGILIQRDSRCVGEPSSVDVIANRCYDNEEFGIAYLSSFGRAENNECWGSRTRGGIAVARDKLSPGSPSGVQVIGNRCHENEQAGISFFSSIGLIEGNECWGSNAFGGIIIQRDETSPDDPSDVHVVANRCYENEHAGIRFSSSLGRVDNNNCWGSRSSAGIIIDLDEKSSDEPSNVLVVANRCHSNRGFGISFLSSIGRVERNDCWGSLTLGGISVERDPKSAGQPSDVQVVGNRCHDNEQAGINFFSSTGLIERNECWGSRTRGGIIVERDSKSADHPSNVQVIANRCHDNEEAGINFFSSIGLIESNDCWSSRTRGGIIVERGENSVYQPSDVHVIENRCHDNEQAGINFFSSVGVIENNDCWDSRTSAGIVVQQYHKSVSEPSEVQVVANRCINNRRAGIVFISSRGRASGNQCWNNTRNSIEIFDSELEIFGHSVKSTLTPDALRRQRLDGKLLGQWIDSQSDEDDRNEALASFLSAGGCTACFRRYWVRSTSGDLSPLLQEFSISAKVFPRVPASASQESIRIYRASRSPGGDTSISAAQASALLPTYELLNASVRGLSALLPEFGRRWQLRLDGKRNAKKGAKRKLLDAPKWAIGLVSADDQGLTAWLDAEDAERGRATELATGMRQSAHVPPAKIIRVDRAVEQQHQFVQGSGSIERFLARSGEDSWLQLLWLRIKATLFVPASERLIEIVTCAIVGAVLFATWAIKSEFDFSTHRFDRNLPAALGTHVLSFGLKGWFSELELKLASAVAVLSTIFVLWNRVLPTALCFRNIETGLNLLVKLIGPMLEWVMAESGPKVRQFLSSCTRSKASQDDWLRRNVFGLRRFDWLRRANTRVVIVALCGVDSPSPVEVSELRTLMRVCPRNQPLLLIAQMPGLSMLVGGFLDVWFASDSGAERSASFDAFVINDIASASLGSSRPSPVAEPADLASLEAGSERAGQCLGHILGWEPSKIASSANALADSAWTQEEWLVGIVIGSTPYMHMLIERADINADQFRDRLRAALKPYLDIVGGRTEGIDANVVSALEACMVRSQGLWLSRNKMAKRIEWVGRVGYRKDVADAVSIIYRAAQVKDEDTARYLGQFVLWGVLFNLTQVASLLDKLAEAPTTRSRWRTQDVVPLHFEAVLFLVKEWALLAPSMPEPQVIAQAWEKVVSGLQSAKHELSTLARGRVCTALLRIMTIYKLQLAPNADARGPRTLDADVQMLAAIDDPFSFAAPATAVWPSFLQDVRNFLRLLTNREPGVARRMLAQKLAQDWYYLPDDYKSPMYALLRRFPTRALQHLAEAGSVEVMLARAEGLKEQPALLVAGLAILARSHLARAFELPPSEAQAQALEALSQVADALLILRDAANDDDALSVVLPVFSPHPDAPGAAAAAQLLQSSTHLDALKNVLVRGRDARQMMNAAAGAVAGDGANEEGAIEGIALGPHGQLHRAEQMALELDAFELRA